MTERSSTNTDGNGHARNRIARPLVAAGAAVGIATLGAWTPAGAPSHGAAASMVSQVVLKATPKSPAAAAQHVTMANFAYSPATLTVGEGTTVSWTNNDATPHTVTSSGSGPLNSGTLNKGGSYNYTFNTPGTYAYYCTIHPFMHGTVVVMK
ncbi:cupredoxin family copper-binding protein [Streptomyces sp. NPDC051104]|uniref:cupredoxin domain-containing protein n=1 Tax=Streptomyces sp. NPDC051104 TaxID=3155044 RepID=UPI0034226B39